MRSITAVTVLRGFSVQLTFDDGSQRSVDLEPLLRGEMFAEIRRQPELFRRVRVDAELGTIVWPDGADMDPDVLHGDALPAWAASD